jgi:hypothetical protein
MQRTATSALTRTRTGYACGGCGSPEMTSSPPRFMILTSGLATGPCGPGWSRASAPPDQRVRAGDGGPDGLPCQPDWTGTGHQRRHRASRYRAGRRRAGRSRAGGDRAARGQDGRGCGGAGYAGRRDDEHDDRPGGGAVDRQVGGRAGAEPVSGGCGVESAGRPIRLRPSTYSAICTAVAPDAVRTRLMNSTRRA